MKPFLSIGGVILFIVAMTFLLPVCCGVSDHDAARAFEAAGLENAKVGGYAFLSCSEDDSYKSHFTATNAKGAQVEGVICCGVMKSCTLRY